MATERTPPPLTSAEVAERFAVSSETVKNWADQGKIPFFRTPGGHYRFARADVEALLAEAQT